MKWLKQQLRQRLRSQRQRLTTIEHQQYAYRITERLRQQAKFQQAHHIALYMPFDNEVCTEAIMRCALTLHKSCYLPVITATKHLNFRKADSDSRLSKNKFGIFEPTALRAKVITGNKLDMVLVPLVAFDTQGHRLGMGGGYYDRTFSAMNSSKRPLLVGLGYDFQRVQQLPFSNLDISLDMVVTDKQIYITQS